MKKIILSLSLMLFACSSPETQPSLQMAAHPTDLERLAAKELIRYVYLCTGVKLRMHTGPRPSADFLLSVKNSDFDGRLLAALPVLPKDTLGDQSYAVHTLVDGDNTQVVIRGGSPIGLLYGAYRFIEALGVRFYLHDDVLPGKSSFRLPDLHLVESPQFELRGIQPFHDFPEGPDWWSLDDYKAVMTQLAKMRMNFIGFHTYPATPFGGWSKPEPMVWHGLKEQIAPDGMVTAAYPVLHFHTADSTWGYDPLPTSAYAFGAAQLFDADNFGAEYMKNVSPWPHSEAENLKIFNTFGAWQKEMFTYARRLGVKTCIGTETPLTIPAPVQQQLVAQRIDPASAEAVQKLYEGTFERIKRLHPLDYYWFWTPEYWTWQDVPDSAVQATERDLLTAIRAAEAVKAPFTLATCGWVLGPPQDRAQFDRVLPKAMPFSCINREVGFTPVDSNFARLGDRPAWAVSWLEDDPALISPQLWVGRVRRDAVDARRYGCNGFMGIHWRTEILSPALAATAQVGWSFGDWQKAYDPQKRDLPVDDFYLDWATANFGEAGAEIAAVFSRLDGGPLFIPGKNQRRANLYRTSDWAGKGPGGVLINPQPWEEVRKSFAFIDELEVLRNRIEGAAHRERFDYWLNTFRYDRALARVGCRLGELEKAARTVAEEKNPFRRREAARRALDVGKAAAEDWGEMVRLLLSTVNSTGAMGTLTNLEQHNLRNLKRLKAYDELLAKALGEPLPEISFPADYRGEPRLIVPTRRSILESGEPLRLQVMVLSAAPAEQVTLHWRPLGEGEFRQKPFAYVARGVYRTELAPAQLVGDIEYFIQAQTDGQELVWPVTAPETNRTVIIW